MAIRVFIIDDHALVRAGIRMILEAEPDMEIVGEAESGELAMPLIRRIDPDVVLCDLNLPGFSGMEVTERVIKGQPATRVVIVSVLEDGPMPRRIMEAGASGYVGKGGDAGELTRAVRAAAEGKRYLSNAIAQHLALAGIDRPHGQSPLEDLSLREIEVGLLLAQGLRQVDIAGQLSLSPKTISTHKARLFDKLGVDDTVGLARLLRQHGLVDSATTTA